MAITADSIAAEIYLEIGSPCDLKSYSISYWIRTNLGTLNSLIGTSFSIPTSGIIAIDGMGNDEEAILKQLYIVKYYDNLVRGSLYAASTNEFIEISSDGAVARKINKNELSKTYLALKNSALDELKYLVGFYNANHGALPRGIVGDDNYSPLPNCTYPGAEYSRGALY